MSYYEPIVGRYVAVTVGDATHRIFFEEAGQGIPLLCLHTAGADSRQWRHVLNDAEITRRFRVIAFDLPVIMGCSMGGAISLKVAAEYSGELTGIVGLEATAYAPGRYNEFLHHPAVHGGELCASYTFGLCAPSSPEVAKRENWWYYSQGGPGVYAGDVHYY